MTQFMVDAFNTVSCKFFWTKVQKRVSNALARWWLISFNTWRSWRESHALVTATMSSARNGIWLARSWTRCSTSLVLPMSIWARGRTWRCSSSWTCVVPYSQSPLRRRTAWWRGRTSPSCSSSRGMTTSWRYRCHSIASLWILSRIWLRSEWRKRWRNASFWRKSRRIRMPWRTSLSRSCRWWRYMKHERSMSPYSVKT